MGLKHNLLIVLKGRNFVSDLVSKSTEPGFESDGNAVPVLFYITGTSFPLFFFCILQLTVILSSLIFISLAGPPLTQFNPLPYVKKWLAHGHRGAYDNQSRKRHAMEESRYSHLNKIFE